VSEKKVNQKLLETCQHRERCIFAVTNSLAPAPRFTAIRAASAAVGAPLEQAEDFKQFRKY